MSDPALPLAAFDLDGTVTWADAFTSFLRARVSRAVFWAAVAPLAPLFPAYLFAGLDRKRVKERFATRLLGGANATAVAAEAEAFWDVPGQRLLRADALEAIESERAQGRRTVLVTACPELVARPLAQRLSLDLIGTRLEAREGRLTGRITGDNCRGGEKVARLKAAYGEDLRLAAAYGDSTGDREMLAAADTSYMRPFRDGPRWPLAATIALWL